MDGLPAVSCMCLTYGRPKILEEAVHSFLIQDYPGPKELVVLNDFDRQTLVFDHPDVAVINVSKRFRTVGEKRNACAALSSHDLLAVWDDDDVYLPHRLSYSIRMYDPAKRFFKPSRGWVLDDERLSGPKANLYPSGAIFGRDLFDEVRGYRHMGSGQDMEFELAVESVLKAAGYKKNFDGIQPRDIYYIYRWRGTGSYHLSGFGRDKKGKASGNERVAETVARQIADGEIRTGRIALAPAWKRDYGAIVAARLAEMEAKSSVP